MVDVLVISAPALHQHLPVSQRTLLAEAAQIGGQKSLNPEVS
jgi:hypothetical protein